MLWQAQGKEEKGDESKLGSSSWEHMKSKGELGRLLSGMKNLSTTWHVIVRSLLYGGPSSFDLGPEDLDPSLFHEVLLKETRRGHQMSLGAPLLSMRLSF